MATAALSQTPLEELVVRGLAGLPQNPTQALLALSFDPLGLTIEGP